MEEHRGSQRSFFFVVAEKERLLRTCCRPRQSQMRVSLPRHHAPAGRALNESLLDERGPDDFLDGVTRLAERGSQRLHADRAAVETFGNQSEIAAVEEIGRAHV